MAKRDDEESLRRQLDPRRERREQLVKLLGAIYDVIDPPATDTNRRGPAQVLAWSKRRERFVATELEWLRFLAVAPRSR